MVDLICMVIFYAVNILTKPKYINEVFLCIVNASLSAAKGTKCTATLLASSIQ